MRVKTNGGALASAAILAAVLTFVTVGDGSPPKPASGPAVAVRPMQPDSRLPAFHRVGEEPPPVTMAPPPAPQPQAEILQAVSSPDALVFAGLRGALTYLLAFVLGHLALRRFGVGGRWAYAGLGAASALICVASQTLAADWTNLVEMGSLSFYLAVPLIAGLIMGFLYQWRAGLEADGDDPALLEATLQNGAPAGAISADGSLVDTGQAEYFDGPLQVRTTFPVAFVAALLSAGIFGLVRMAFGIPGEISGWMQSGQSLPMNQMVALAIQSQLPVIFFMGMMAPVPFAALVMLGHVILRAWDKTSRVAYLLMGAAAPVLLLLVLGPMGILLGLQAAVPMAVAMSVYRNMAGVEPKQVKEDIMVSDRRHLVGADHARRRFGRLIKT
jgi:hypothetical protein